MTKVPKAIQLWQHRSEKRLIQSVESKGQQTDLGREMREKRKQGDDVRSTAEGFCRKRGKGQTYGVALP